MVKLFPEFGFGDYSVFSDESCVSGHRHMLIGGLSCRTTEVYGLQREIEFIRKRSRYPGDSFQWTSISKNSVADYRRLLDFFVELNSQQILDFTCIVINTRKLRHAAFNQGDGEVGFQKFMNEFLRAIVRLYKRPPILNCYHGRRDSRFDLQEIKGIVNSTIAKREGYVLYRPIRQFEYMDVNESGLHQLADVLLGSVAFHWNDAMRRNSGSAKTVIAKYANAECCPVTLGKPTTPDKRHFNIWELRMK